MTVHSVLIVEDDAALRDALAETLKLGGQDVLTAADGEAALAILERDAVSAVVTDYQMAPMNGHALLRNIRRRHPDMPVLMMTAHGTIERAVRAIQEGANDYLVKPFEAGELIDRLERLTATAPRDADMIAEDPATRAALEMAHRVADSEATVLLTGESGTGKEVFARCIHRSSPRASGPFIAINCAAIPENMLESVLFGHEKGAFTGAHAARAGKFEQAQGGTLLLDEISEMALSLQAKLLRVLQEREVERVGGARSIPLDVRVLATTNRDLRRQVVAGEFREDLYYRLSVFPLALPPLRERSADILPLARHFLADACRGQRPAPEIGDDVAAVLEAYHWPGNVRELANLMQRALILSGGPKLRPGDLRFEDVTPVPTVTAPEPVAASDGGLEKGLRSSEERLIIDALQRAGSRKAAAEILGISARTLRYKIARLREDGVDVPDSRRVSA